jgi:hypothetical protein
MMKNRVPLLSLCLFSTIAFSTAPARAASNSEAFDLGISAMSYQMNRLAANDSGQTSTMGTQFVHLYAQGNIGIGKAATFSPSLRYAPGSLFATESPDGGSTVSLTTVGLPFLWHASRFNFGGGPTLLRYEIDGKGGQKTLNNGTGQATFGLPGRKVATTTTALSLIGQGHLQDVLIGLDLLTQGLGSSEKRSFSLSLVIAYAIGG